jgi:hypothetical protein
MKANDKLMTWSKRITAVATAIKAIWELVDRLLGR